ncbi:von Willebrand factor [Planctomycetes bacterium CA13]|uniref:von Willebrand factor n=1 Tax=Novipirellula herctigrandis TaxID=2527986 RepID=A0A5C5YN85_9BACT|nr:von Willebrand factor [Planctomycetes bacterium CA13]
MTIGDRMAVESSTRAPLSQDAFLDEPIDNSAMDPQGDRHDRIVENPFLSVSANPLSTFSIDVDTASYSKVRQYITGIRQLPRPDAVRIEELINYFSYAYAAPTSDQDDPFAAHVAIADCPWNESHRLVRVAIKGYEIDRDKRPATNLVLLLDTSGSMNQPNKLPLLKQGMRMLLEQLNENDSIAVVTYAGSAGLVLDSTPANEAATIRMALDRLDAGGSTNGGDGIRLAYQTARDHFIPGGTNRVLLCTDGDFNVGTRSSDELMRLIEKESKSGIDLSVLGFGMGNFNDAMLEQLTGRGDGNYAFIDSANEARKVLVDQLSGTLTTIAKDVKIQIEFNPQLVSSYRLIGYENRLMRNEDFNDDKKDAGEIGAGHTVTALYEIAPSGNEGETQTTSVDPLKYQQAREVTNNVSSGETLTIKLRYKIPGQSVSRLMEKPIMDDGGTFESADREFQFAAAVAGFGMLLRGSEYRGNWSYADVVAVAASSRGPDKHGLRGEFVDLVQSASELSH